jgi:hypothetical protein
MHENLFHNYVKDLLGSCHALNIYVPPKFICSNLNPKVMASGAGPSVGV